MTAEDDRAAAEPRLDALVCRLAGGMSLLAAAVFLACAALLLRLPLADLSGTRGYRIPGTTRLLDATVLPVLVGCGGVAVLLGLVAFGLSLRPPRLVGTGLARASAARRSPRRALVILLAGAAVLALAVFLRR